MVHGAWKKSIEAKLDVLGVFSDFMIVYLCKFAASLEEKAFKQSLELLHTIPTAENKLTRLLYCVQMHFPAFFESMRLLIYLKEKIKQVTFETYDADLSPNCELYKIESFLDDLALIAKLPPLATEKEFYHLKHFFVFVNLFCYRKKVLSLLTPAAAAHREPRGQVLQPLLPGLPQTHQRSLLRGGASARHSHDLLRQPLLFLR